MPIPIPKSSRFLAIIQESARCQGINPYQITKSSGLPLTTVQRLLSIKINLPLRNVEMLLTALGMEIKFRSGKSATCPAARKRRGN